MGTTPGPRVLVGKVLIASAVLLGMLAVGFGFGWISIDDAARPTVAVVFGVTAVIDLVVALRFLGE